MMLLALGVLLSPTFSSEVLHDVLRYSVDYLTLFFSVFVDAGTFLLLDNFDYAVHASTPFFGWWFL